MEGVTILNTMTEEVHAGGFGMFVILGIILIILGVVAIAAEFADSADGALLFLGVMLLFFGAVITVASYPDYGPVTSYNYSYEVTVDDGVDFNAFNEKYDIIKQRGAIYTVVEKDTD